MNWINNIIRIPNWIFTKFIRFYQLAISPWLGSNCKFVPTCSQYSLEALSKHNIFKACYLIIWRILRCHPFNKGGYDPVPQKNKK
ncbi:MAG: membrane protein insertion efficiency factor YidD [Phycisphaerae bacterium]|nr:membrane protein insertion efficiency factor YidD [Phycisphaerae bacterium]